MKVLESSSSRSCSPVWWAKLQEYGPPYMCLQSQSGASSFFFGYKANVESILSTSRAENNNVKSRYLEVELPFLCAIDVHSLGDVCNEGLRKL
jgi:hypothetical protein